MNNLYNQPLSFNGNFQIKKVSFFDSRKVCFFDIEHKKFKKLDIVTRRSKNDKKQFVVSIKDKNNITMAKESFLINKKNKEMYEILIKTVERYRNSSLAEILRLTSIITMLENNIQKFKLFSLRNAEAFHRKYNFKPEEKTFSEKINIFEKVGTDMFLTREDIIKNKDFYNQLFKKHGINYQI